MKVWMFLFAACAGLAAQTETDVSGAWSGIAGGPVYLVLKQDKAKLSGTVGPTSRDQILEFQDGSFEDGRVRLKAGPIEIDVHFENGELRGTASMGNGPQPARFRRAETIRKDIRFEVASVKPAPPDARNQSMRANGGRVTASDVTLLRLIGACYAVKDYQISGFDWLRNEHYDIEATMPPGAAGEELLIMMQNLLADRFHLELHRERRELQVYALESLPKKL